MAAWQIVPYTGKTAFKRVRVRDDARIRDIVRHLQQAHECVALIGPPFSEKSRLLGDVATALRAASRYRPLYLDLWQASSQDEAAFFTSLAWLIYNAAESEQSVPMDGPKPPVQPAGSLPNAYAFQHYLAACTDAGQGHLVLLIDHLQALPHDLVHGLLLALRAAYMERSVDEPRQLVAVVSGGMNLVGLSAGTTSPFNIARPVLAPPLDEEQSLALAEATLDAYGCSASNGALARLLEWAGGDRYLIPRLCAWSAGLVQGYRRNLIDRRVVDRAADRLWVPEQGGSPAPLREAIRAVEEDPDTVLDVLHLLEHGSLPRSRARQMPTRTGADRLMLTGAVMLANGCYTLKNLAYQEALARHFTTERVGHILRIAGRWQEAIAYLAPQLQRELPQLLDRVAGQSEAEQRGPTPETPGPHLLRALQRTTSPTGETARTQNEVRVQNEAALAQREAALSQLLEATVQSIYASDALAKACELLARGLQQGFGLAEVAIYQAVPAQAGLELVYPQEAGQAPATISLRDPERVEARTFEYGRYALRGTAGEARLVVALSTQGRRLGIVTIEHYGEGYDPRELPSQLPELLHFLEHAAGALQNVLVRAAYREIGQAVLDAGTLQPTLHRVLDVAAEALGCDAAQLYLLEPGPVDTESQLAMTAGIGQAWNAEWQALARYGADGHHPAAACLRSGRMQVVPGADERLNRALAARFGLDHYTWVYLPLQAAGQPLGTLELGYSETFRLALNEESRANLSAFANQVAIAVHNMQLLRRTDEALARRVTELEKLRSSSLAVSGTLDVPTVLARIISDLQALFPDTEATIWECDLKQAHFCVIQSSLSAPDYLVGRLSMDSITGRAVTTGQVQIVTDLAALPPEAGHEPAVLLGLRGLIAVPLVSHDRILGAINLYSYDTRLGALESSSAELLQAFAAHAAVAIDNARLHEQEIKRERLEQELAVAQQIQRSLLPTGTPQMPGWQFAALYQSARVVGGDFYDFVELRGESPRLGLIIADVADKGVPAAIFMALTRTIIRTMALSGRGPAAALTQANQLILQESRSDLFLTALYAVLDPAAGRVIYANAGHTRPLYYAAATGALAELVTSGVLLGVFDGVDLEERRLDLLPGDVLMLFTDGITDALNEAGEAYGDARLAGVIAAHAGEDAQSILAALIAGISAFAGEAEQADDITCVVVKREPAG
jgi:serine phosphatase RsbU (regulator of sigma subunit)